MFCNSSTGRSYIRVETKKKMDRLRLSAAAILIVCVFIVSSSITAADERRVETSKPSLSDILSRNLLSFSTKIKSLSKQARAYFFPASIDFRGANEEAEAGRNEGGSAGQKVKEAVAKSFEESKATVEDSAKSAAKVAKEKLKESLSPGRAEPPPQSEL